MVSPGATPRSSSRSTDIIDAIIGVSVAYKAFENMGGFDRIGY
jgi:hypothetical protein